MAERDFSEIARLSERFNKDPKSRIFVQLADAYRKSGMIDEALDILHKGLTHHPNYPLAHLILGKCFYDKRMYEQAKDAFKKTLGLDPQNIVALRMLAQTCASTKDEQGQIDAYKGLIAIDPFDAQAKEKLDELQAKQRTEPLHTVSMAKEYEVQGDLKKALEIYEHLLYTDPTDIGLQQKIKELKAELSTENKTQAESGIEELQVEAYFQPDQLVTPAPPAAPEAKPTAPPGQSADDVMQLEDFLSSEPSQAENATAPPVPEPTPGKEEVVEQPESDQPLDIMQTFGETPAPAEESIEILEPTKAADIIQPESDQQVSEPPLPPLKEEEPPVQEHVPEPAPEPSAQPVTMPPFKPEEPPAEPDEAPLPLLKEDDQTASTKASVPDANRTEEEILDLLEPIEEKAPPEPSGDAPPEPASETPETPDLGPAAPDATPAAEVAASPASPEEQPTEPEKPKDKPKEEDFQSFQDWLSGLLK